MRIVISLDKNSTDQVSNTPNHDEMDARVGIDATEPER
jgi:hypothetical protein